MLNNPFVGTWKLLSMEARRSDGQVVYPLGEYAAGIFVYDALGNMAVQIMRRERPPFASGDMQKGTSEELKAAAEGYLAAFGTYTVDEAQSRVLLHVQGSLFPNWIGTDQIRHYRFEGDRLTLETPSMQVAGMSITVALVWERLSGE